MILLTRDQFRMAVFKRDGYLCIFCKEKSKTKKLDSHHILDRKLFPDGGYYLDNGATVCEPCHLKCENGEYSVGLVRHRAGITNIVVPPGYSSELIYDKWGNCMQKHFKYPHTMHLPWSPGLQNDDKLIDSLDGFVGKEVVITEKMDGENTTMYEDHIHARSIDSKDHPSRTLVKGIWGKIKDQIPSGWRICGENVYAKHSIYYDNLSDYFLGFSVWDDSNRCLEWDNTLEWFALLGVTPVRTLWRGLWNEEFIKDTSNWWIRYPGDWHNHEGYVIRITDAFMFTEFDKYVGKFVRKGHVQTDQHWLEKPLEKNELCTIT